MRANIVLRILKWIAAVILIPPALVILAVGIINYFDEDPSAEVKALSAPQAVAAVSENNGYIEFLGFDAPPGENQRAWGVKVLERLRAQDRPGAKAGVPLGGTPIVAAKDVDWCNPTLRSCLGPVAAAAFELLQKHSLALERYRAMRDKPEFVELYLPVQLESAIPAYMVLTSAQRLSLLGIAAKVDAGELEAALGELEKDFAFHRRVAAGARTIIGKMVANRLLANDVLFLSDLLRAQREPLEPFRGRIAALVKPLTPDELKMSEALRSEYAVMIRVMLKLGRELTFLGSSREAAGGWSWWDPLAKLGYRPNATANSLGQRYRRERAVIEGPATGYERGMAEVKARTLEDYEIGISDFFVNPVGKLLRNVSEADFLPYAARMHDLNGLFALVALQHALYASGSNTPESISSALAGKELAAYANPYTGKPMEFDPKTNTVFFLPKGIASWTKDLKKRWQDRVAVAL